MNAQQNRYSPRHTDTVGVLVRGLSVTAGLLLATTAAAGPADVAPAEDSILLKDEVTFSWENGDSESNGWVLLVGTSSEYVSMDIHAQYYPAGTTSAVVDDLPTDGTDVFVSFMSVPYNAEPIVTYRYQTGTVTARFAHDDSVTAGNPLKGFMTSYAWGEPDTDFPSSLEFAYVPLSAMMDGADSFTFTGGLEPLLEAARARNHQLVLRPYIDYPNVESGLPDFLDGEVGMTEYTSYGGGSSPDYSDADLQDAVLDFVAALGAAYDGDPRLAFVQAGLLGFWGEWHTYTEDEGIAFADADFQGQVLQAYSDAFTSTHIQARYPDVGTEEQAPASLGMGFHDDSFAHSTCGTIDWFFQPRLEDAGADESWQSVPIGGELRPELQGEIFAPDYQTGTYAQDFFDCLYETRASYLLNYTAFNGGYDSGEEQGSAEQGAIELGYEFFIPKVTVEGGQTSVTLSNSGIAPFYYPLEMVLDVGSTQLRADVPMFHRGDGPTTVTFDTSSIDALPSEAPWQLSLHSDHILDTQEIRLANSESDEQVITVR